MAAKEKRNAARVPVKTEPKGKPRSRRKGPLLGQLRAQLRVQSRSGARQRQAAYLSLLLLTLIYGAATVAWAVPVLIAVLYAGASIGCFIVYAIDKAAAREGRWRTPERTLLLLGLVCGWPGAVLAQLWLRHKSAKPAFQWLFWTTVALNLAGFVYLSSPWSFLRHF